MKHFVISLERRSDRRKEFDKNNGHKFNYEYIPAVDGSALTPKKLSEMNMKASTSWTHGGKGISDGEVGCFISHHYLWELCVNLNEPIAIFEDDVIVDKDDYETALRYRFLADFVYISCNDIDTDNQKEFNDDLVIPGYAYNLSAYIITPKAAKELISTDILQRIIPADEYAPEMHNKNLYTTLAIKDPKTTGIMTESDVTFKLPLNATSCNAKEFFKDPEEPKIERNPNPLNLNLDRMDSFDLRCRYTKDDVFGFLRFFVQHKDGDPSRHCCWNFIKRDFEDNYNSYIIDNVKDRSSVISAGAWQGMYPFLLSNMFDEVWAFEPDPINFHCLVKNCQRTNIYKFQAALGSKSGMSTLEMVHKSGMSRLEHEGSWNEEGMPITKVNVPVMTIDSLNIQECGLIMSDTEGSGYELLKGAEETIKRCKPQIMIEAYHIKEVFEKEVDFLKSLGYKYFHGWDKTDEHPLGKDMVFVPS